MDDSKSYLEQLRFDPTLWGSLPAKWITNFRLVLLLIVLILVAGIYSIFTLPRRLNPEVKIPIVSITTALPGAGPEDIESLVTKPLEDALLGMDKLDTLTSTSQDNVSIIVLSFLSTADVDKSRDDAQSLIDSVTLPDDAQSPKVIAIDFENEPVWQFALSSRNDSGSLMRFAETLRTEIEELPSVNTVDISGLDEQEIRVQVEPGKMQQYGLNPFTLSQTVGRLVASYPAGTVKNSGSSFALSIDPEITTIADVRNIRITTQDTSVRLGDIATVVETAKPDQARSFIAGPAFPAQRAVTFAVYKSSSANIDTTAEAVVKRAEEVVAAQQGRYQITNILNAGAEITKQYVDLLADFRTTTILVFINLFLFLGLRQALIASLTIPLTFLSGLIFMNIFGISINFISLFAFLLALGNSIDDTIVVVSSMTAYYRTHKFTAAETGLLVWRDFIVPIWSTTITTICAYVPLLLTTGIIGEFIKPIPMVVTATMVSSTFLAVLVTLPLMIIILRPTAPHRVVMFIRVLIILVLFGLLIAFLPKTPVFPFILLTFGILLFVMYRIRFTMSHWFQTHLSRDPRYLRLSPRLRYLVENGLINVNVLARRYQSAIARIIISPTGRRNTLIVVILFALFSYLLVPLKLVKNEFFPNADAPLLYMNVERPAGTDSTLVEQEAITIANTIRKTEGTRSVIVNAGRTFTGQGINTDMNAALITLLMEDEEDRSVSSMEVAQKLRYTFENYPAAKVSVQELSGGPPAGADIQIKLLGEDLDVLDQYANSVMKYLDTQPGVVNPEKSIKSGTSKVVFVPDMAKLSEAGVSLDQIGLLLRTYASGFELDSITVADDKRDITFRMNQTDASIQELGTLAIQTQTGSLPLLSLGELKLAYNPTRITREDGKRTISVSAGVEAGFNIGEINSKLVAYANSRLNLPAGYRWETGGVNEENARSVQSIIQAMGLSFLLILITMVVQFGSYRRAAIVLLLIPLAVSGVFIVFALTATPLSFPALIGILALFGIVVTNAMFIVDKIQRNEKEGMGLESAIIDAAESRLEPIMLTSLTTIVGLIPITLSDPLWRGLGGAIIAGLSFSGIIMLFFVPVVYYMWHRPTTTYTPYAGKI